LPDKSLAGWLSWLETLSPREIVLGLERVNDVLSRLALRRPEYVCSIAGTNGKGSSAAIIEAILGEAGERTGCYTSPHLSRYNERIRIAGRPCGDADIIAAFNRIEEARGDVPLTYFEFGTLAALVVFDQGDVTAAILEVGMGGRLDAVNAIEPDGSIITNVGLDHCAWLGDDIESIAAEKAGIMRSGRTVVFAGTDVPAAISQRAEAVGATLLLADRDYRFGVDESDSWSWQGAKESRGGLPQPRPGATIQVQNAAGVLALLEATGKPAWLDAAVIRSALTGLKLEGRMQIVECGRQWLLDVAHNPDAGNELAGYLAKIKAERRVTAIFAVLGDKNVAGIVAPLCSLVDRWIAVSIEAGRAVPAVDTGRDIANSCGRPCQIACSIAEAMEMAENVTGIDDLILVGGSFYVVGPALDKLYSRRTGERET